MQDVLSESPTALSPQVQGHTVWCTRPANSADWHMVFVRLFRTNAFPAVPIFEFRLGLCDLYERCLIESMLKQWTLTNL